jgi:transcription antitermination factor NusB
VHLGQLQLPLSEALLTCPAAAFAPSGSCSGVEVRVGEAWLRPQDVAAELLKTARAAASRALGEPVEEADPDIFKTIVNGVVEHQEQIDAAIMKRLATGWKIERLDATSRAILRAAVYELVAEISLPSQIILDEYVSLAHAFFEGAEPKFINGLLDAVSRDVRAG